MKEKVKKPFDKRWWFIVLVVVIVIAVIGGIGGSSKDTDNNQPPDTNQSQSVDNDNDAKDAEETKIPSEYKSALKKAESYSELMHMSKAAIYEQLVSEYGEQFTEEAAQYAMDNLEADWNANALAKAKTYRDTMDMSPAAIYDQLVSEYGEQFTPDQAQYAIDHLDD